jgi:cytochrome c551/c552
MIQHRPTHPKLLFLFISLFVFLIVVDVKAQDGKALFSANCASCHSITKDLTGPALQGVTDRGPWSDKNKIHEWVHNPTAFMAKDPYTAALKAKFGVPMNAFPNLKNEEIDAIIGYVTTPVKTTTGDNTPEAPPKEDNTLLYGVLTLILAVVALTLLWVNSNLKKLSDDKEGHVSGEPVPFFRNKAYIAMVIIVLFLVGGYYTIQGAVGLGRMKNYEPEQPIYYSHKVHAGINQISCLYCHGGAQDSKHANIPSVNICMNCHMAINEYSKGPKLVKEDGTEVDGTAEIKKIYAASGWDPEKKRYTSAGKPIEWIRIHNLPDHVYFNHSQHVKAGKQQCQTCHGEITKMDEVYQFAELSMGWCINCHRETKVDFYDPEKGTGNKFYSIYAKFHEDIKNNRLDSVTVEKIGGTECQKCHY